MESQIQLTVFNLVIFFTQSCTLTKMLAFCGKKHLIGMLVMMSGILWCFWWWDFDWKFEDWNVFIFISYLDSLTVFICLVSILFYF